MGISIRGRRAAVRHPFDGNPFAPLVRAYTHNVILTLPPNKLPSMGLLRLGECESVLDLVNSVPAPARRSRARGVRSSFTTIDDSFRDALLRYARIHRDAPVPIPLPEDPVGRNVETLAQIFGLSGVEASVLMLLLTIENSPDLGMLFNSFGFLTMPSIAKLLSGALAVPTEQILLVLPQSAQLFRSGLVTVNPHTAEFSGRFEIKDGLLDLVVAADLRRDDVFERFLPAAPTPTLAREDFASLDDELRTSTAILGEALRQHRPGVNILLFGPTGTGKTEFARLLAREVDARLYAIGKSDAEGGPAEATQRLASLRLGNRLVGRSRSMLLFDEIEDLFHWEPTALLASESFASAKMSKQWINDALETNDAPTIWITNRTAGIDGAFLRRFSWAVEFRPLGARQRARALARHLGDETSLTETDVEGIAERFATSPAQFGTAVATARLATGGRAPDRETLERILRPIHKLVTGQDVRRERAFGAGGYRLDALNSSADLAAIADRLAGFVPGDGPGPSICLYGPPGTGKSEFARYLAHRMDRRVVYRRVSDLQSKWLGETEKNIAAAFREAEDDDALLLFDEVDSFLRDRGSAVRSWEVTEVNEFLAQLESFRGVVVCTTNLWRDIDEAALRRFAFKIELRYPTAEQRWRLFEAVIAPHLAPWSESDAAAARAALARLPTLAPGDFAAVARRLRLLDAKASTTAAVDELTAEVRAKRAAPSTAGF